MFEWSKEILLRPVIVRQGQMESEAESLSRSSSSEWEESELNLTLNRGLFPTSLPYEIPQEWSPHF